MNLLRTGLLACIGLIPLSAVAADALPRVFFTPQERDEIVQLRATVLRLKPGTAVTVPAPTTVAAEASPTSAVQIAPHVLRLDGLSIAKSGATFAWISGQRYANGARVAGHRLDISAQGVVIVDTDGRSRRIRVGELLDDPPRNAGAKP